MSNKKHNIEEIKTLSVTPATPDLGYSKIYPKSDGEWYRLNDAGNEAPLGGDSGGTVTSVGLGLDNTGTDISISDSPITTTGDITLSIPDASASARGALTANDWSIFNDKIDQTGGAENYLSKFTADTSVITVSQIYDDGTNVSINSLPLSTFKFNVSGGLISSANFTTSKVSTNISSSIGVAAASEGAGSNGLNLGVYGVALNNTSASDYSGNIGVYGAATGTGAGRNTGIYGLASAGSSNTGGHFQATGSNSRAVRLEDSTSAAYRVLRCLDANGNAEWTQNLYSVQATNSGLSGLPATLTASTQLGTSPVLNHGSSDPNAVQVILPAEFDNGLASSYDISTGLFTAPATGWYFVGVSMSLTNILGWPTGTSLLCSVELTNNTASTIVLGSSTVDNYQPKQILLDTNRVVYLASGQEFRLTILLKGTANYTSVNTDSIKWSIIRTA